MWEYINPDELYHWKYIKKVRKNGSWVYYYDKSQNKLSSMERDINIKRRSLGDSADRYVDKRYKQDMKRAYENTSNNPNGPKNVSNWYNAREQQRTRDYYIDSGPGKYKRNDIERDEYFKNKHSKTVRGKIDKFMAKNGVKMAKDLTRASDLVVKGKSKLKHITRVLKSSIRTL